MSDQKNCSHCAEQIIIPFSSDQFPSQIFCCHGCQTLYEILQENSLGDYYQIRQESGGNEPLQSIKDSYQKYKYLDDNQFIEKHVLETNQTMKMSFYLEGVHCLACLWLLEKLPQINSNILYSELNMSKSTIEITINKNENFSNIAKLIESLGYPPHAIMDGNDISRLRKKEDHKDLIRIVISFFCAGNIMLMAFSIYAGASGAIKEYFDYFSMMLFAPIIFYTAIPFYRNTIGAIKTKTISIDLPIVFALIAGTIFSVHSVLTSNPHVYFDSLAILILLLLLTRFLLKKSQHKGLAAAEISNFFSNIIATKITDSEEEEVHAKFLKIDDTFLVKAGETIPCDGIIIDGHSSLDTSLMTGEVNPTPVQVNSEVYSGTVNLSQPLKVKVTRTAEDSKLGSILQSVEKGWSARSDITSLADKIAKYFIAIVFVITGSTFYYFYSIGSLEEAIVRSLAIIIITCPCALGLATPLCLSLSLSKLARIGIIAKDASIFERVSRARNILFDKTGTLTYGKFKVQDWRDLSDNSYEDVIFKLESYSKHPIAQSIQIYLTDKWKSSSYAYEDPKLTDIVETPGVGVQGHRNGDLFSLRASSNNENEHTIILLFKNNTEVVQIELADSIRPGALKIIQEIKERQIDPYIVSGDSKGAVLKVGSELTFPRKNTFFAHDPEAKKRLVMALDDSILIGDGANDAIALTHASVGIAVHGSVDISLRAADVFLSNSDLTNITRLLTVSEETLNIIYRNLNFSILYNIVGIYLAINGLVTPLYAAIIMPLSSITVVISSILGNKKLNNALKADLNHNIKA